MANTPQARKRIRRNEKRAEINGNRLGRIRTFVKKVEAALEGGDKTGAAAARVFDRHGRRHLARCDPARRR